MERVIRGLRFDVELSIGAATRPKKMRRKFD